MIRLMCPHCQSIVSVPDSVAGHEADCPSCGKTFSAPARYTPVVAGDRPAETPDAVPPSVDRPPPPPGLVPPDSLVGVSTARPAEGLAHRRTLTLSPRFIAWIPLAGSVLIFLLTFLPWVGLYPGGYTAYTQSGWGALFGGYTTADHVLEDILQLDAVLRQRIRSNWELMTPYMLGLLFFVYLALAERLFHNRPMNPPPHSVAWMGGIWKHRMTILTGVAALMLCVLVVQALVGFGLERAVKSEIASRYEKPREAAAGVTAKLNRIDIEEDMAFAQYRFHRTTWLYLALLLHVLVLLALVATLSTERRGAKPAPRLALEY